MNPERVAIVGIGVSHLDYIVNVCKVGNRKAVADEVWAINKMGAAIHCDAIFRMDDLMTEFSVNQHFWKNTVTGDNIPVQDVWYETLKNFKGSIFTCKAYPEEFPNTIEYPLEEVINCVGTSYFNTGPAYAIAYAMLIGVKEIQLYGIDYTYPDKHISEQGRACVEFHLREAMSRGINIKVAQNSTLLDTQKDSGRKMYGYPYPVEVVPDKDNPRKFKVIHREDLGKKIKAKTEEQEKQSLKRLLDKYYKPDVINTLLDTPEGAVQEEPLKGETQCQVLKDSQKELQT